MCQRIFSGIHPETHEEISHSAFFQISSRYWSMYFARNLSSISSKAISKNVSVSTDPLKIYFTKYFLRNSAGSVEKYLGVLPIFTGMLTIYSSLSIIASELRSQISSVLIPENAPKIL